MKHAMMFISCVALIVYAAIASGFARQVTPVGSIHVNNGNEADFVGAAPISLESAVKTALLSTPGKAFKVELESVNGYLVYRIGIVRDNHQIDAVEVDAGNRRVLNIVSE